MGYERRRRSSAVLNLTPLIDIVFLLLVFFLLTAHFIEEQQVEIELPVASSSGAANELEHVEVIITPDGALWLNGQPLPPALDEAGLVAALKAALGEQERRRVRLRGDTEARFGLAVRVMDAARLAGATSLDILTEHP